MVRSYVRKSKRGRRHRVRSHKRKKKIFRVIMEVPETEMKKIMRVKKYTYKEKRLR